MSIGGFLLLPCNPAVSASGCSPDKVVTMKALLISLLFLVCLLPVAAEPLCKMDIQDPEQVLDQAYWNKEREKLWQTYMRRSDFAEWNQRFDQAMRAKVNAVSSAKIIASVPLHCTFELRIDCASQKIVSFSCVQPSVNSRFDSLCENVIKEFDVRQNSEIPEGFSGTIRKPIEFEMPSSSNEKLVPEPSSSKKEP